MERLEIRVEKAMREQLANWATAQGISLAEAIRQLIDRGLNLGSRTQRKQNAARQLFDAGLVNVPGPATLEDEIHLAVEAE